MSTGNLLGGAAGGVAGYFAAGALGVSVGGAIIGGAIIGSLLGGLSSGQKMVMEYGKLSSRNWQGSEYGGDIPRGYGTFPATGSQIVWLEHNKLKEVVKKKKSGGKGGGGGTVTKTYSYYATFALMLCQGEVAGVRRIWCGDKLIYNAGSDDLETIIASNQKAKGWKLYRGTDDQLPDPRYEADVGVGNAPAFRGYTYIVFSDFALKDYSNTLQAAQFKVELVSKSSTSIQVVKTETYPYQSLNGNNIVFIPRPYYMSSDRVDFYSPNWDTGYPPTSSFFKYTVRTASASFEESIGVVGTGAPPNGRTDVKGEYFTDKSQIFGSSGGSLVGPDGHFFKAGNYAVATSHSPSNAILLRRYTDLVSPTITIAKNAYAVALDGDVVVAVCPDGVYKYDSSLVQIGFKAFSFASGGDSPRVDIQDGVIYYHDDTPSHRLYTIPTDLSSVTLLGNLGATIGSTYYNKNFAVSDGMAMLAYVDVGSDSLIVQWYNIASLNIGDTHLADVISAECSLSALISPSDLDVSMLTQKINGYRVSGGTIRSVIEPLQGAYPFDVVPSGYKIKFVPRGQAPVVTIPWEDLAAANGDEIGDSLPYSREMDSQLPQKVTITALSSTREYGAATQSYERLNTSAVNVEQRDIPLVLSDDEIAQMSDKLLFLRWLERDDFSFSLPPTYLSLEPADVVTVQAKFGTFELRNTEINYEADGRLTCKAKPNSAPLYTSRAVGAPGPGPSGTIPLPGESVFIPLDIPVVDETVQNEPGFVGVMTGYTEGWPGGLAVRSNDDGQTWVDLQAYAGKATLGKARGLLPASNCALIDMRTLTVDLISGELESVSRDLMLSGTQYAAYGADGRWEIVRFYLAPQNADGSYAVSGFVRGERGTEWATGLHQAGDWFVMLDDPDNAFIGSPVEAIGLSRLYRGITQGATIDSASDIPFTYKGVNLECLSPVYAKGTRDVSSNFSGSFTRRSRLGSTWWLNGIQTPVGETSEAYEINVISGTTVKRTISVTSPAWSYLAADQTLDFGSPQSSITFRIYQLSGTVGRGYPLEVTL